MGIATLLKSYLKMKYMNTVRARKSFSQCGEDLIVDYIFSLRGINQPTYLDIGANDPYILSNTARFYNKGSRGIVVEANPKLSQRFSQYRPKDINLNVGVGPEKAELNFYLMEDHTLSTFSLKHSEEMIAAGAKLHAVLKIQIVTVKEILDKNFGGKFPDFLNLDVEGIDFDILQSINFAESSPSVICVEVADYSSTGRGERRPEMVDFLINKGYFEYANTNLNAIMVKNDFWFN